MIAYLEKYDTTVDVPDNIGEKDLADINDNFHSYVGPKPESTPETAPQWKPNFYESVVKPMLPAISPALPMLEMYPYIAGFAHLPGARAFTGKMIEEGTFGAAKPLLDPLLAQDYQEHPAYAAAGRMAGGIGSLLATGGALKAAGLAAEAGMAGKAAVEAGFAAGERFIPRAIMTGATFGTRTFIAETVKAFEEGGVNLQQFGEHVLKDTAFGAIFGTIGGLSNATMAISSAAGLGFVSSKMNGADNREASLNAAIWAAFETVGSFGKTADLRLEALRHLKGSVGEYIGERNPAIQDRDAARVASQFVDNAVKKAGFDNAEDLAKSGPENLLEGIEKVNQLVRSHIPAEAPAEKPDTPAQIKAPNPVEDIAKAVNDIATNAMRPYAGEMAVPQEAKPPDAVPERPAGERWQNEPGAMVGEPIMYLDAHNGIDTAKAVITLNETDQGIAFYTVHDSDGRQLGGKFADETEAARYAETQFPPDSSQKIIEFTKQHQELSEHDIAQMAYDKGLIDEPNSDLLKLEIQKAKGEPAQVPQDQNPAKPTDSGQEETSYQIAATAKPQEMASRVKESAQEIAQIVDPTKAAPLAARITREQLGKMARSYDMAEAALSDAKDFFDKQPKEANLAFIDRVERGQQQPNQAMRPIHDALRKLLDDKRDEIRALGTGKLSHFIENYFPHIWDQGEKQVSQAVQKASKRPFEGSKGFLKQRSKNIEFTSDGIAFGLTPVSFNPVDLTLLKIREMDKYLMAHRTIHEYKANGLAQYVKVGGDAPEGWTKIDDRISTIFKSPMIAVKEAFDQKMMEDLNSVGKSLGIDLERSVQKRGEGQKYKDAWGLSQSNPSEPGTPGKIWTKFAGPESALAHELGHQIDHIYGLQKQFLSDQKISKELIELANERATDNAKKSFKQYIQKPEEKMAVMMESYIHAPDLFKSVAPTAFSKLEEVLRSDPKLAPLTEIEPSLVLGTGKSEVYAGGTVIAGHIYAQPDAARIINNYLSPGLQKSAIYQTYRYAGNLINQFQLGFSAFHLGFTSLDASVSKFALALNELAAGHPIKSVRAAMESPTASISNVIRGNSLLKAWRGEGQSASDNALAEAMASAGGRARMDQFYATSAYDQMKHHFEAGNVVRGILHIPLSIAELSSKPILEWIVPRQKLGVFADIMKMEMQNNPNLSHDQMREIAQRAWDSVDNRMGQLVYDNLFWNRTFKDLLMGSVRSVGWNLGTIRELAGGAQDYAEAVSQAARGKKTEFTYRMAYFAALPIVVGTLGAMIQYLRTGKGPREMKDYFFPKTGGLDANGDPHRVALPSYMKDLYHYKEAPLKTISNKLSPILAMMGQMFENQDFYGVKIRNEDDPLVKQVASEAAYMFKQITPFSVRNMQKNMETQNKSLLDTIGPWVGITPAPYDIDQTKAEKLAHEIAMSHQEIGGRTQEQADRSRLVGELTRQYRRGDPKATEDLYKAYQDGKISHHQMQQVILHANMTPLQRLVKGFSLEEAQRVYDRSNDEEKGEIESILQKKMRNKRREFVSP